MQGTWALTIRSLRQDSRLLRYHLLRFAVAALLAFAVFVMWESGIRGESPGRDLLSALAYMNLFAVTIVGGLLFAPTITEEKEEQTLGLLRMTRIGPSSLLLGKALPKLALIVLVLIVQLPLVFLTRTLGGVDWPLITNVYLLIFCQLIGVVSISMVSSVVMRTSTGAVVFTGAIMFCWWILAMILDDLQRTTSSLSPLEEVFRLLVPMSPITQMDIILQTGANVGGTFQTCIAVLLLSTACYLFGVWTFSYWNAQESTQTELELLREKAGRLWRRLFGQRVRHSTQAAAISEIHEPESPTTTPAVSPTQEHNETGRTRRSHACWQHAIAWKDYFLLGGGRTGFRTRCVIAMIFVLYPLLLLLPDLWNSLILGTFDYTSTQNMPWLFGGSIMTVSLYAFGLDLLYLTVNLFASELKQQTWESLILLPQSLGSICRQKIWGAAIHLTPWIVSFILGLALSMSLDDVSSLIAEVFKSPLVAACVILHVLTMFITLLLVLTWLSLRLNPWVTILISWFLSWGIGILYIITIFIAFGFMSGPGPIEQQILFHVGWLTAGVVTSFLLLRSIRSTLQGEASAVSGSPA